MTIPAVPLHPRTLPFRLPQPSEPLQHLQVTSQSSIPARLPSPVTLALRLPRQSEPLQHLQVTSLSSTRGSQGAHFLHCHKPQRVRREGAQARSRHEVQRAAAWHTPLSLRYRLERSPEGQRQAQLASPAMKSSTHPRGPWASLFHRTTTGSGTDGTGSGIDGTGLDTDWTGSGAAWPAPSLSFSLALPLFVALTPSKVSPSGDECTPAMPASSLPAVLFYSSWLSAIVEECAHYSFYTSRKARNPVPSYFGELVLGQHHDLHRYKKQIS